MNINRRGLFGVSSFFFLWSNSFSNLTLPMGIPSKLESYLDFFFLVLPTLIVLYILIPSLGLLYNKEFELDNLTYSFSIEVVGHQWYWSYQYKINTWELFDLNIIYIDQFDSILIADDFPRLLCVDNPLVIPTYTNILLIITSADVIHSWALPSAGIKVDAIPGRVASTNLFLFYEKYFFGQCSELCGANHGFMPIMIRSISRNLFFSYITNVDYSSLFDY
jgi:heme/copper-type cytochrome/quinol oxidase subunit 2